MKHGIKDKIFNFARCVIETSNGKITMAFNEENKTTQVNREAAHFLKYNDKRIGRDLELYAFINEVVGTPVLLTYLLDEIIFRIKKEKWSKTSSDYLKEWGFEVNKQENRDAWIKLFD